MKNKFFVLFTSVMVFASGFTPNVLANEKVELNTSTNVCSVSENHSAYLACCFNPDLVWVSSNTQVCKNCGRVYQK